MKFNTHLSRLFSQNQHIAYPLALAVFMLALYSALRVALVIYTGTDQVPLGQWPILLIKGLWFDVVVTATLLAPALIYGAIIPNRWRTSRTHHVLRAIWLSVFIFALLFGAVAEFTFWIEFSTRFNFIALDYLIYTHEVIGNIRESYPVGAILSAIGVAAALIAWALQRFALRAAAAPLTMRTRIALIAAALIFPTALLTTSRVEQMDGQKNAYADELSGNGLFTLAAAARRNELDYMKFYRTAPEDAIEATLAELGLTRLASPEFRQVYLDHESPAPLPNYFARAPKHLVLISVESLSASFLGSYGSTQQLTPNLDALARDGMRFENVYATGTRTVRGLEALSLGTPPVPGQAIVRRPANDHLNTLGEVLEHQGFESFFFYGGYGYFDNMNAFFAANDYEVIDRTDIPSNRIVFENVWGVADEVLFDAVIDKLDRRSDASKPFFAHVMTTSNHRPFTYPQDRIDIPSPGGRSGAVKYTDYAIGKFMKDAATRPWFKDTLFVIVADHCASVAGKSRLPVANYRIPLILYAPGNLKPGIQKNMVSQIDIVPSMIHALGKKGGHLFFGQSFLNNGPSPQRAFISNYQELGYLKDGMLTVLSPKHRVQSFSVDPVTYEATPAPLNPQLLREAIAYYQSASSDFRGGRLRSPFYAKTQSASRYP